MEECVYAERPGRRRRSLRAAQRAGAVAEACRDIAVKRAALATIREKRFLALRGQQGEKTALWVAGLQYPLAARHLHRTHHHTAARFFDTVLGGIDAFNGDVI